MNQTYLTYLESSHWAELRMAALNKANRRCEACRSVGTLHGHHLIYRTPLTDCTVDDIMALCEGCHMIWHEWLKKTRNRLDTFSRDMTIGAIIVLINPVHEKVRKEPKEANFSSPQLPEEIERMVADYLTRAPRCGGKQQRNWAIKQTVAALKTAGRLTGDLRARLLAMKSGSKAKKWAIRIRQPKATIKSYCSTIDERRKAENEKHEQELLARNRARYATARDTSPRRPIERLGPRCKGFLDDSIERPGQSAV